MSGMIVINVAGWATCGFYKKSLTVLTALSTLFPTRLKIIPHELPTREAYRLYIAGPEVKPPSITEGIRNTVAFTKGGEKASTQYSSPFSWIEGGAFVGGCDDTLAWCKEFINTASTNSSSKVPKPQAVMVNDGHATSHGFEYDVIVIGGGSGGLATSKACADLGAKTACLDFVKPSPAGSNWGLGGTCVNVGCIPKKLMHTAAIIGEINREDATAYGWTGTNVENKHDWVTMRESIQDHIRGLNFKYRVSLREKNVTYLNKLGKFIDKNTLELTDKKGKVSTVTASRFVVAVGGRPSVLDCEGGDLAISSDDLFSLENSPGKTLCVGASYISLECAGFLTGLGHDVTVAVRSILLRGFDREIAEKIGDFMAGNNCKFKKGVLPTKLVKTADKRIDVTFDDGSSDVYDTVLVAIGRNADTTKLNLDGIGVKVGKNNKIACTHEQTSVPNIYAIGDCMEDCPELTPVAIQAGIALSKRLFEGSRIAMDYKNICTTVFTPIEYGVVGYGEEEAYEVFGEENVEVYHTNFNPLEWSFSEHRSKHPAFAKLLIDKTNDLVIGFHYLGPNAGEVMQGFGVSIKIGVTMDELKDTVGIHPTCAEVLTTMEVTKSSGKSAESTGC